MSPVMTDPKTEAQKSTEELEASTEASTEVESAEADREFELDIRGVINTVIETTQKKGRNSGKLAYYLKIDPTADDPFENVRKSVGAENFNRTIMNEVIRPACNDATHDSVNPDTGVVEDTTWAEKFCEQFLPGSRRPSSGIKQLREKLKALFDEMNPFLLRMAKGEKLTDDENNRYLSLLVEYGDQSEKIESSSRKGKKGKKAASAPAQKTAVTH